MKSCGFGVACSGMVEGSYSADSMWKHLALHLLFVKVENFLFYFLWKSNLNLLFI